MHRDVRKQAEQGRKMLNKSRDLSATELRRLFNIAASNDNLSNGIIDAVVTAYFMGAATGIRQGQQAR